MQTNMRHDALALTGNGTAPQRVLHLGCAALLGFALLTTQAQAQGFAVIGEGDFDGDGHQETLALDDKSCAAGDLCDWHLIGKSGNILVSGQGKKVAMVPSTTVPLIDTDGVLWTWDGLRISPFGSLLETLKPAQVRPHHIDMITTKTAYTERDQLELGVWEADLLMRPGIETIMVVYGTYYSMGGSLSPYAIFDAQGELLVDGISMDMPRIFAGAPGEGFTLVDVHNAGFTLREVRE
jgi:hypothetical protein